MNFFKNLLKPSATDEFGIDAAIDGLRHLTSRLAAEKEKLEAEKEKLRDAALAAPDGDLDEMPVIRQKARIEALEMAYERALDEAATSLQGKMPAVKKSIDSLEKEKKRLDEQRDKEFLTAVAEFIAKTGASLEDSPRRGHGGIIRIPATSTLELDVVKSILGALPKAGNPAPTAITEKISVIRARLEKLTMLSHYGPKTGLQTLARMG